jgi:dihydropteroate synthase
MGEKSIKGRWWDIEKNLERVIEAKYDRIKDWKMDPKGYFLIKVDRENNLVRVGYCRPDNKMVAEITGKTALEIVNTLIKEGMVSTLQHAADMGIELCKAELALKYRAEYVQDGELELKD